jgi:hypothetical protein
MSVGMILNQAYERAAEVLPPDADPADYIVILPDWGGHLSRDHAPETPAGPLPSSSWTRSGALRSPTRESDPSRQCWG